MTDSAGRARRAAGTRLSPTGLWGAAVLALIVVAAVTIFPIVYSVIMSLNNVSHKDELSSAEWLIRTYDLKLVSITLGGRGSLLVRATESSERNDELKALSGSDGQTALPRRDHLNL